MSDLQASAPGRVNLIGEHTDYNGGFVLPMPIPQRTTVGLRRRSDGVVSVTSRELVGAARAYVLGTEAHDGSWLDYIKGCTAALRGAGHRIAGCDLTIQTDVPLGSGLSSSAALEVAVLRALRAANELELDDVALALLGQRAENELVGVPSGAMDQLASSLGAPCEALFIDLRSLAIQRVPLPPRLDVMVIGSEIKHALATGSYRIRRAECDEAARLLGVAQLRELGPGELDRVAGLPAPLDRRARHVITENERVLATVDALHRGDHAALGRIFAASHASMRDDFEITVPEIDELVALAVAQPEVIAARMTGGGFGGSIVVLAQGGNGPATAARIAAAYAVRTGLRAPALLAGRSA